jgi:hypothetical protein
MRSTRRARTDGVPALGKRWHSCSSPGFVPTPLGWLVFSGGLIVLAQYSSQLRSRAGSFGLARPVCQHKWARSVGGPAVLVQPVHGPSPILVLP